MNLSISDYLLIAITHFLIINHCINGFKNIIKFAKEDIKEISVKWIIFILDIGYDVAFILLMGLILRIKYL